MSAPEGRASASLPSFKNSSLREGGGRVRLQRTREKQTPTTHGICGRKPSRRPRGHLWVTPKDDQAKVSSPVVRKSTNQNEPKTAQAVNAHALRMKRSTHTHTSTYVLRSSIQVLHIIRKTSTPGPEHTLARSFVDICHMLARSLVDFSHTQSSTHTRPCTRINDVPPISSRHHRHRRSTSPATSPSFPSRTPRPSLGCRG